MLFVFLTCVLIVGLWHIYSFCFSHRIFIFTSHLPCDNLLFVVMTTYQVVTLIHLVDELCIAPTTLQAEI